MANIFIILLGCNIHSILMNRLETSFAHIGLINKSNPIDKIVWFLSGGVKYHKVNVLTNTEAHIMKTQIDNYISSDFFSTQSQPNSNIKWDYVLDELSTNTAENLIRASKFLNNTIISFDSIYIVTSEFHHERASMMVKLIDNSRQYKWILGDLEESDSRNMEKLHMKNVHNDISRALTLLK